MSSLVSIDIGLRTLSIYKEYFDIDKASKIPFTKTICDKNGLATEEYKKYVDEISKCGNTVFLTKKDLGEVKEYYSGKAILNLFLFLDELNSKGIFDDVQKFIIERQLTKNSIATALMYHIQSWLLINFGSFKKVILFPAKNKTRVLGAPLKVENNGKLEKVNKAFRKKWSVMRVFQILKYRNEENTIDYIFEQNKSKKDDLSDVIVQCLAYNILVIKGKRK